MTIYVNIAAAREGDGSKERPFKSINEAAQAAKPGDEVLVAPGIYREYEKCGNRRGKDYISERTAVGSGDHRSGRSERMGALQGECVGSPYRQRCIRRL